MQQQKVLVLGMGQTGLACVRYLHQRAIPIKVIDTRETPPALQAIQSYVPASQIIVNFQGQDILADVARIIVSPGVDLDDVRFAKIRQSGLPLLGDFDLFQEAELQAHGRHTPYIAITGSNGKTTVTHMMHHVLKHARLKSAMIGNVGVPALDILSQSPPDYYVVECSSFQLDLMRDFHPYIACFLNITPDHIDRHGSFERYLKAKQRIFLGAKHAVYNRDDSFSIPQHTVTGATVSFGLSKPTDQNEWGIIEHDKQVFLAHGTELVIAIDKLTKRDDASILNALATAAMATLLGIETVIIGEALQTFEHLPHRMAKVGCINGVTYWNDSKATNMGAALAALNYFNRQPERQHLFLIAGGDAKGADLTPLGEALDSASTTLITLGKDGDAVARACSGVPRIAVKTLQEAVAFASKFAQTGDVVLLSPACASLDMFSSYIERGEVFISAVQRLCKERSYETQ